MAIEKSTSSSAQDARPGKKKIKTTKVVDGHETEVEIEVDDIDGPSWPDRSRTRLLNHALPRVDGPDKVSGRARYTHDVRLPGMLYARLLCCPYPVAKVTINPAGARALPGVAAAIVLVDTQTRYLGQPVAAVAAATPELCDDALRALKVSYTALPWAVDSAQAIATDAPLVRKTGNRSKVTEAGSNDEVQKANAEAAGLVDATYSVPVQHHASLETHGVVVDYRGGNEATVYASTQATFSISEEAANVLQLKASDVTAIVEHMGGGFGAKFGLGFEGQVACRLAKELGRPIHLMLTRPDEFVTGGNRSGCMQRLIGGMSADGRLLGVIARVNKFGGLQDGSHPGQPYVYGHAARYSEIVSIYTNTNTSVAMRAPGHPQASFGMESLIDELAYKVGLDPLEVRKTNLARDPAYVRQLDAVARAIGWAAHPFRTAPGKADGGVNVGIGFGIATWGGGGRPACEVDVKIERDGSVSASVGSQDLGTGTRTYIAAIVAEEFGLELGQVTARIGSSRFGQANGSGGSTTTASLAPAVKHAASLARTRFAERIAPTLNTRPELVSFEGGQVKDASEPSRALAWKQACATLGVEGLVARGTWQANLAASGVHGVQAARVSVDTLTGRVQVLEMVGVQDCGLPLNRMAVESQLNGGMIQALSYALLEERVIDPVLGLQLNANLEDYKIAGTFEIPEMSPIIDDGDTRNAVIGMAEAAIIPGHSAIANAVFNACGARVRDLPLTPDKVLKALKRVS